MWPGILGATTRRRLRGKEPEAELDLGFELGVEWIDMGCMLILGTPLFGVSSYSNVQPLQFRL